MVSADSVALVDLSSFGATSRCVVTRGERVRRLRCWRGRATRKTGRVADRFECIVVPRLFQLIQKNITSFVNMMRIDDCASFSSLYGTVVCTYTVPPDYGNVVPVTFVTREIVHAWYH